MNIFVSTQFCLPKITDAELREALKNSDAVFEIKLIQGKNKKRTLDYRGENPGFQEVKMKTGQVKLIALDCKVKSDKRSKITCWNHCGRPGHEENGMPVMMRERVEEDEAVTEVGRYGYFCGCSCMYAFVLDRSRGDHADSVKYKKIALNAEILYKICHPNKGSIIPAKPWELLRCNGGTLDYDVWEEEDSSCSAYPASPTRKRTKATLKLNYRNYKMDLYIFLTVNIIWLTLSVLYHLQREFLWKKLGEVAVVVALRLAANPAVPLVVDFIRKRTPEVNRKRKFIEFRYVAHGQSFVVPVALNGEHIEAHSYVLKKGGAEVGRIRLPARVPLLVSAQDLGCDEILPLEE